MSPHWQFPPYAAWTGLTAVLAGYLSVYAWKRRSSAGAAQLALLTLATAFWALAYTLELLSADLPSQILFAKLAYPGIVSTSPAWYLFARRYTGRPGVPWGERHRWVLWAIPLLTVLLVATNERHALVWRTFSTYTYGDIHISRASYGPWFWVHAAYSYLLLGYGTWLLVAMARAGYTVYRHQSLALMLGILPPWIANGIYLAGYEPLPGLDLTVIALFLSGLVLTLGLYRYHLLDIIPVAAETILEAIEDGILVINSQGVVLDLNRAAARLLDLPREALVGARLSRLLPTLEDDAGAPQDVRLQGRHLQAKITTIKKYPALQLVYLHDITALQQASEQLREQNRFLEGLNALTQAILSHEDEQDALPLLADQSAALFGARQGYIVVSRGENLQIYPYPDDRDADLHDALDRLTRQVLQQGRPVVHSRTGTAPFAAALVLPLISDKIYLGALCIIWKQRHVIDEHTMQRGVQVSNQVTLALSKLHLLKEVRQLAVQDDLTGVYNHRYLNLTGQQMFFQAQRYGQPFSILMFDLDHFKEINDQYGHLNGDLVLRQVARRCRQSIRKSDILIRYGGDEFVVLLPVTDASAALEIARRVHATITLTPVYLDGVGIHLAFSMGVAELDAQTPDLQTLIRHADQALYQAKRGGRNQIFLYTADL